MANWFEGIGCWMVNSCAGQFVAYSAAFLLAAVAVTLFDDWYKRAKQIREEASIAALEELYALRDPRGCRRWQA